MNALYLVRGVPGSGKSTLAKSLLSAGVVDYSLEADQYFTDPTTGKYAFDGAKISEAHLDCQHRARMHLLAGNSIAVCNTSTTEKEVETYSNIADKYSARFVSLIVENRHSGKNTHGVPEEKIQQMKDRFSVKL